MTDIIIVSEETKLVKGRAPVRSRKEVKFVGKNFGLYIYIYTGNLVFYLDRTLEQVKMSKEMVAIVKRKRRKWIVGN